LLIAHKIFKEIQFGFLVVGHTHEDIDGSFGYLSKKLKKKNNYVMVFDENIHAFPISSIHSTINSGNP
jgi:hypothetical protein